MKIVLRSTIRATADRQPVNTSAIDFDWPRDPTNRATMSSVTEEAPIYSPFFGVMGAASAIIFSGEFQLLSGLHRLLVISLARSFGGRVEWFLYEILSDTWFFRSSSSSTTMTMTVRCNMSHAIFSSGVRRTKNPSSVCERRGARDYRSPRRGETSGGAFSTGVCGDVMWPTRRVTFPRNGPVIAIARGCFEILDALSYHPFRGGKSRTPAVPLPLPLVSETAKSISFLFFFYVARRFDLVV